MTHTLLNLSETHENIPKYGRNIYGKYNPLNIERIYNKILENYDCMNVKTKRSKVGNIDLVEEPTQGYLNYLHKL